jgi:Ala-tRNA(Pro) deacylase
MTAPLSAPSDATPDALFAALDRLGIAHPTVSHPPLFTVEQSRSLRGAIAGGHTKNLFLRDKKGALFLVTALEDAAIELKSLHRRLGATGRFSFGSADLMMDTLGVAPGAVTPFGAINDTTQRVTLVLDAALMEHAVINAHPLTNTMTTSIGRDDLVKFLESTGHSPRIVGVAGPFQEPES